MRAIKLVSLIGIVFAVLSCESNTYTDISGAAVANPTYEANINPMMRTHCTSCHGAGGEKQDVPFETYEQVTGNAELIACRIDGTLCTLMPASGRIPQSQIDMFNLWITQGYVKQ